MNLNCGCGLDSAFKHDKLTSGCRDILKMLKNKHRIHRMEEIVSPYTVIWGVSCTPGSSGIWNHISGYNLALRPKREDLRSFCLVRPRLRNVILGRGSHICKGLELREHDFYENCKQFSTSGEYEIDDGAAVKREDI